MFEIPSYETLKNVIITFLFAAIFIKKERNIIVTDNGMNGNDKGMDF